MVLDLNYFDRRNSNQIEKYEENGLDNKDIENKLEELSACYVVDRVEEDVVVCEERNSGQIIQINKKDLLVEVSEGDVLKKKNGIFEKDEDMEQVIKKRIERKMQKLWKD